MILQLSCLTHAESIHDVWDKADAPGPLGDRLSCFESVYHWILICMEALKRMLGPPGGLAQWFEAGYHQSGLNLCTISNLQLSSRPAGTHP